MDIYNKMMKAEHALKFTSPRFVRDDLNNDLVDVKSVNKSQHSYLSGMSSRRSRREIIEEAKKRARLILDKVSQRSDRETESPSKKKKKKSTNAADLQMPDISMVKGSAHNDSGFSFLDRELLDNADAKTVKPKETSPQKDYLTVRRQNSNRSKAGADAS